ncbi:MAG: RNase H-like domain-containing protein [Candidatus Thiodiazotropha taylori]|nr:DDE-type integrase/transposase/recombinase [Candidatus Thiodiazotropha taylori]MCW4285210.1 RNase H-like domain-containing protein [Candidatus Thiodiazotropha taylori]
MTGANGPASVITNRQENCSVTLPCDEVSYGVSILLPISVSNIDYKVVLDTGSAVTILSSNVYNKIPLDVRPPLKKVSSAVKLEAANDGLLSVLGEVCLEFKIQKDTFKWDVFVAPIREDGLLGLDFLQAHSYSLSSESGLKLNKRKYKTIIQKVHLRAVRVICKDTIVLPANCEMVVPGMCPESTLKTRQAIVTPTCENNDREYMVGHTLVDPSRLDIGIPVRIMNPTDSDIIINSKTVIGVMQEVEEVKPFSCTADPSCSQAVKSEQNLPDHLLDLFKRSCKNLTRRQSHELKQLLIKHEGVFAKSANDLGKTSVVKHKIYVGDSQPIRQRPRRAPRAFASEEDKIIEEQLKSGVIRESTSPWASPLVYVRKKDGGTRPCVDYRKLNELGKNKMEAYPIPRMDDCLESLGGAVLFSNIDLQSGYWQIEVDEVDKPKTAFVCRKGLYEYNTMPFGLSGGPATFQRCMELVMRGLQWSVVIIYLDDLIIHAKSFSDHLQRLDQVFSRLSAAGLKLKSSKCNLFQQEVVFLGHVITENGIKPDMNKVKCIKEWPIPRNVHDIRSFCGFCSYYRKFIRNFSQRAAPINKLLEAGQPFVWTEQCQKSFEDLKSALTGNEVMAFPRDDGLFIVDCDASDTGIGGVLSQMQWCERTQKCEERPIAYASKSLTKPQRNYCTTRKELLAVVTFVQTFKQYLLGRQFTIRSDHSSLRWLISFKNPEGQIARWIEVLSHFDYKLEHRNGARHGNADGLSRISCDPEACQCYDGITVLENLPCGGCSSCRKKHEEWSILADIDDVKPLMTKRVDLQGAFCAFRLLVLQFLCLANTCGERVRKVWSISFLTIYGVVSNILGWSHRFLSCFYSSGGLKRKHSGRMCFSRVMELFNYRLRAQGNVDSTGEPVKLGEEVLTKDFGIGTHAGGLFPEGSEQMQSQNSEVVYNFSNWVGSYSETELAKMQLADPDIGTVLSWKLQSQNRPSRDKVAAESPAIRNLWLQWQQLFVQNGLLFRKWVSADSTSSYYQFVLPSILRREVLKSLHNDITSAHLGVHKTVSKVKQNFYWYKMNESVRLWIKQCSFCEARKRPAKRAKAPLKEYSVGFPLDRVSIDILGPFPVSKAGSRFILVVQDNFTKFVEAYAIADQTAETVANKLVLEFFSKYGLALDVHSDQAKNFQSELFRQVCCLLEINQTKSTSYRPCSNGMVERFNQTLVNMITTYVNKEQNNWDVYLPIVTSAYRSSVHETTGYSPNYLMFGRHFNLPIHFLVGLPAQSKQDVKSYTDYVVNLNEKFSNIYDLVRKNLKANAIRQKRDYDSRIAFHSYSVGDIVYILDSSRIIGKSPKLKREVWKGPLVVVRKLSDILYELKGNPKSKPKIIHHDRIRPFKCSSIPQWVLSLQQDLKVGNTFVDSSTKKVLSGQGLRDKTIDKQSKVDHNPKICMGPELSLGKRTRKPPERLQL